MAVAYLLLPWRVGVCDQSDGERERERERESYTAYHIYLKKTSKKKVHICGTGNNFNR